MATDKITVRGAGIFGLSIAWVLTQRGAQVQLIDPCGIAAGASGGIVGALAPHVPENWNPKKQFQLESLLMAEPFWAEVEAVGGIPAGYARTGRLQPIADDAALALAHTRADTAKALWGQAASWVVRAVEDPAWAAHSPTGYEIYDTLSARIHPRQACTALAAALAAHGVSVQTDGPETSITLYATGVAGLDALNAQHPRRVGAGIKGQAALLDFAAPDAPQLFADTLHIIPHADGTTAIGSTTEREFDDPSATDTQLDGIIARAREYEHQFELDGFDVADRIDGPVDVGDVLAGERATAHLDAPAFGCAIARRARRACPSGRPRGSASPSRRRP